MRVAQRDLPRITSTFQAIKLLESRKVSIIIDEQSHQHLVQRLSIALQRGNAASVLGTLSKDADFGD